MCALVFRLICAVMMVGGLAACGAGAISGDAQQDAAQRFFTERNNGTPVALAGDAAGAPLVGEVEAIDGTTLTLKHPTDGTTTTVELAAGVQVAQDKTIRLDELKAGDQIVAFGSQQGNIFEANMVQAGGDQAIVQFQGKPGAGGPAVRLRKGASPGEMPAGGEGDVVGKPEGVAMEPPLMGVVERVEEHQLVVKKDDGSTATIELADNGEVRTRVPVEPSAITAGAFIQVNGTTKGDVVEATGITILGAPLVRR